MVEHCAAHMTDCTFSRFLEISYWCFESKGELLVDVGSVKPAVPVENEVLAILPHSSR